MLLFILYFRGQLTVIYVHNTYNMYKYREVHLYPLSLLYLIYIKYYILYIIYIMIYIKYKGGGISCFQYINIIILML